MSLLFMDGFDMYTTLAHMTLGKWNGTITNLSGNQTIAPSASNGRLSTASLRFSGATSDNNRTAELSKSLASNYTTLIVGFAIQISAFPSAGPYGFCSFVDGSTRQVTFSLNTSGQIVVTRNGSGGTALGTTSRSLTVGVFQYLELKVLIDGSVGTVDVVLNGTNILSLTGKNTKQSANAYVNALRIGYDVGPSANAFNVDYDDLYICDTAGGSPQNTLLGDVHVATVFPTSDSSVQFTPDTGVTNYSRVSETDEDGDTSYVASSTASQKDLYGHTATPSTVGVIKGIQVQCFARETDAGRQLANTIQSSGVNSDGATVGLSSSYAWQGDIYVTDPNTSAAWTKTNIDAALIGVKLIA